MGVSHHNSYELIATDEDFTKHWPHLQSSKIIGICTKADGIDPLLHKLTFLQIAMQDYPILLMDFSRISEETVSKLQNLLSVRAIKVFHEAKKHLKFLFQANIPVTGRIFDTNIAAKLLWQTSGLNRFDLGTLAAHYLHHNPHHVNSSEGFSSTRYTDENRFMDMAREVSMLLPLRQVLFDNLVSEEFTSVAKIEFDCIYAIAQMELTGITIHHERWNDLRGKLEHAQHQAASALSQQLQPKGIQTTLFGESQHINLDSQQQVLKALQDRDIPVRSTSRRELVPLASAYPVIRSLLAYRKATKALQGFVYNIPQTIHPLTGRIHPLYNPMGTWTGRFTCHNPNLQQIPRDKAFRHCFIPQPGYKFVIADYSQIELRVVAEISNDEVMIAAYQEKRDLHALTASLVANKSIADITKEERQAAKAVNFGLVYAMGARGLQKYAQATYGVDMTLEEAERFRSRFFDAYRGVASWHESVRKANKKVTTTLCGRKVFWGDSVSLAVLYNAPVQGTAADIAKRAMADLVTDIQGTGAKIVGMIHDEIILETPNETATRTSQILKATMEHAGSMYLRHVPVVAEAIIADSWADK